MQAIIPHLTRRTISYGSAGQADVASLRIHLNSNFGSEFAVRAFGKEVGDIKLAVPGLHNIQNALAAIAVGLDLGINFEDIARVLAEFRGAERRFQLKGEKNGVLVIDDYGHHPTEIKATLAAAQTSGRRVVTLFQPHRYTRTRDLKDEFARSFYGADFLLITDIYAASEDPIEGVTSRALAEQVERFGHRHVEYVGDLATAVARLNEVVEPGDLVLTLGAGNVHRAGDELLRVIEVEQLSKGAGEQGSTNA